MIPPSSNAVVATASKDNTPTSVLLSAPSNQEKHIHDLRNPLPLSSAQEAQVRDIYHKRVRTKCDGVIKDFAACAKGRTVSATWLCRSQRLAMNSCMVLHATPTEEDAAREEWFSGVVERRRKREEELAAVEKRREEVITLTRNQEVKERIQKEEEDKRKLQEQAPTEAKKKGWWG